jgi:hypothetical protein
VFLFEKFKGNSLSAGKCFFPKLKELFLLISDKSSSSWGVITNPLGEKINVTFC